MKKQISTQELANFMNEDFPKQDGWCIEDATDDHPVFKYLKEIKGKSIPIDSTQFFPSSEIHGVIMYGGMGGFKDPTNGEGYCFKERFKKWQKTKANYIGAVVVPKEARSRGRSALNVLKGEQLWIAT